MDWNKDGKVDVGVEILYTTNSYYVLNTGNLGMTIYSDDEDVIEPLFDAGRLFRNAIEIVDGGADFYIPYFDDIKAAIDVLFNTRWAQGHADELVKSAVLWSTKIRLSDDVDGETELEIIKSLVDDIKVIIDECVDEEISLGDFVLTGGEIAAMAVTDAVCRMVPGVLADPECFEDESHFNGLLEYPQYTKPREFRSREVPEVLLSGHHANIEKWREQKALEKTAAVRPELIEKRKANAKTK